MESEYPDDSAPVALSADERRAIAISQAQAARGEFATDDQVRAVWAKHKRKALSARAAILIGTGWINLPVIPWMIAPLGIHELLHGQFSDWGKALLLVIGFLCAWTWWSVNVTLWRRWAERHGVDPDELQLRGQRANILWRRGHIFEQTELGKLMERFQKHNRTK